MPLQNHLPERREISREHFLYPQVLRECEGVTTPAVWPEEAADGWRCTCGCENAPDKIACAACGVGLDWLREHFNRSYLAGQQAANEQQRTADRIEARTREKRRTARRRTVRLGVILAAAAAVLVGIILVISLVISPAVAYRKAGSLRDSGAFLEAAERFEALGKHGEAAACHRLHAEAISGKTDVYAVTSADCPWFRITADGALSVDSTALDGSGLDLQTFIIPDVVDDILVSSLAERGLMNCEGLVSVVIPPSVTAIGERCFFKCTSMTSVTLPDSITSLGERAFINCSALETLTIPAGVTAVPIRLCNNCTSLREVKLPDGITAIGDYAFSSCSALETIDLPAACRSVGDYAFSDCGSLVSAHYRGKRADLSVGAYCDDFLAVLTYEE